MRIVCLIFAAVAAIHSFAQSNEMCTAPIWSVPVLRDLSGSRNPASPFVISGSRAAISFVDIQRLIAHEVVEDTQRLSSRESPETSSPFRLHVTILSSMSGAVESTTAWATRSSLSNVLVTSGGIIVRTGEILRFLSKNFVEIRKMSLSHADPYEGWELRVSATGKTVLLNHYDKNWRRKLDYSHFEVFDGDTFRLKQSWMEGPALRGDMYTISDSAIVAYDYNHSPSRVILSAFGGSVWRQVWADSKNLCGSSPATMVSESVFVLPCKDLLVINTSGNVLIKGYLSRGERSGVDNKVVSSQDGKVIAVSLTNLKDLWDTGGHISSVDVAVYNALLKRRIATIKVSPLPKTDFDIALSPDGSRLAILNDSVISLYQLDLTNPGSCH